MLRPEGEGSENLMRIAQTFDVYFQQNDDTLIRRSDSWEMLQDLSTVDLCYTEVDDNLFSTKLHQTNFSLFLIRIPKWRGEMKYLTSGEITLNFNWAMNVLRFETWDWIISVVRLQSAGWLFVVGIESYQDEGHAICKPYAISWILGCNDIVRL